MGWVLFDELNFIETTFLHNFLRTGGKELAAVQSYLSLRAGTRAEMPFKNPTYVPLAAHKYTDGEESKTGCLNDE